MALVGVIPAAGFALRLGLAEGSKEMVHVWGKPVMDYLHERMALLRPRVIRTVTRAEKTDVIEHATELGHELLLAETRSTSHSIALAIADLPPDDTVMLGFPDSIWEPKDAYQLLLDRLPGRQVVLGIFESDYASQSDVVILDGDRVEHVLVKPDRPPSKLMWACAVAYRRALDGLADYEYPGELFDQLCAAGDVAGVHLSNSYLEIGTVESLKAARALPGSFPE